MLLYRNPRYKARAITPALQIRIPAASAISVTISTALQIIEAVFGFHNKPVSSLRSLPPSRGMMGRRLYSPCTRPHMATRGANRIRGTSAKLITGPAAMHAMLHHGLIGAECMQTLPRRISTFRISPPHSLTAQMCPSSWTIAAITDAKSHFTGTVIIRSAARKQTESSALTLFQEP